MNEEIASQVDSEKTHLFLQFWNQLLKEEEELKESYHCARNLGFSEWSFGHVEGFYASSYDPKDMDLLQANYTMFVEQISRRKYYLVQAFRSIGVECDNDCVKYWEEEFKKENPNMLDRFKSDTHEKL